jgi:hypothetical protein
MSACSCGCTGGPQVATPVPSYNRPGLPALTRRAGTHGSFLDAMLARLSSGTHRRLAELTTREPDDHSIALLDCWAVVADVLTFYQERIANEGYLRTATEPESLAHLGRLVDHRPRPALGSSTFLAYGLDPGAVTTIPAGTPAKSVPAQDELPQTFETVADLDARAEWSELDVRRTRAPVVDSSTAGGLTRLELAGTGANLKAGDRLLFVFDTGNRPQARAVVDAQADFERGRTVVSFAAADPGREYEDALDALIDAIGQVGEPPPSELARHVVDEHLTVLLRRLRSRPAPGPLLTQGPAALPDFLRELAEETAIAEVRAARTVVDWFTDPFGLGKVVEAGGAALGAALRAARQSDPEIRDLRELARYLACPHGGNALVPGLFRSLDLSLEPQDREGTAVLPGLVGLDGFPGLDGVPRSDGGSWCDCDREAAIGLVALSAMAPALRRPPSRPPASARLAAGDVKDLFGPASDVHPRLLAAGEPRIAAHLHRAWTSARLAEPAALSGLQAMRIKATPFGATAPPMVPERPTVQWEIRGLSERVTLNVSATYAEDGWPATATVTYTAGERTAATGPMTLDRDAARGIVYLAEESTESGEPPFAPGKVIHWVDEDCDRFVLHTVGQLPERFIRLSRRADDGTVTVSVGDGSQDVTAGLPADGGEQPREFGVDKMTLARSGDEVTVNDEVAQAAYLLPLDAVYDGITAGSRVILERPAWSAPLVTRVTKVEQVALADYGLVARVTRLTLADPWLALNDEFPAVRETTVWAGGEEVAPAEDPLPGDVGGDRIELARMYEGLRPGRWLIVSGERTDVPYTSGVPAAELVLLAGIEQRIDPDVPGDAVHPSLLLANELSYTYRRATVKVHGNVVEATQGETHAGEILGSGEAGRPGQSFQLARAPLMWLPAANPLGAESTLTAAVGGVRWPETDGLVWLGATDRGYQTGTADDGRTTLVFGDGVHGARLPTGVENVTATYRTGEGESGNVAAGQISQLAGRPLGVNAVVNPVAATGGTRADGPGDTRSVLPLRTLALDRLVSVRDYEDFARARAGIGKASARRLFDGEREVVHLTIAGVDDAPIDPTSRLFTALESALAGLGDAHLPVRVALREAVLIVLSAGIAVLPDHSWDTVEPAVRAALLDTFSFARRDLGRPAYLSEALAAAQAVPGVDHVDVDVFGHVPGDIDAADLVTLADRLTGAARCVPARPAISAVRRYALGTWWTLTAVARRFGRTVEELVRLNPGVGTAELAGVTGLVVGRGVLPAQLAVLSADLPETLILRRIP